MTRLALLAASAVLLSSCSDGPTDIGDELAADDYVIVGEDVEGGELLNPDRDPEGDQITGEPDGPAAFDAVNDDPGFTDPQEEADEDAVPSDD